MNLHNSLRRLRFHYKSVDFFLKKSISSLSVSSRRFVKFNTKRYRITRFQNKRSINIISNFSSSHIATRSMFTINRKSHVCYSDKNQTWSHWVNTLNLCVSIKLKHNWQITNFQWSNHQQYLNCLQLLFKSFHSSSFSFNSFQSTIVHNQYWSTTLLHSIVITSRVFSRKRIFNHNRTSDLLDTVQKNFESRSKQQTHDFLNSLVRQFDETKKFSRNLRKQLIIKRNRIKSASVINRDKVSFINEFRKTCMKVKYDINNIDTDFKEVEDDVIMIWQSQKFENSFNKTKWRIVNVDDFYKIVQHHFETLLREFRYHVIEVKHFKIQLTDFVNIVEEFQRYKELIFTKFKDMKVALEQTKKDNRQWRKKHEKNKVAMKKVKTAYKEKHEKITKLQIIINNQQKKIEDFTRKINKQRAFNSIENVNEFIRNSLKQFKQSFTINSHSFAKSSSSNIFWTSFKNDLYEASFSKRKFKVSDILDKSFEYRKRFRVMKLNERDKMRMSKLDERATYRSTVKWSDIKDFDEKCFYEKFLDWIRSVRTKFHKKSYIFDTKFFKIEYLALHCTKTAIKYIKNRLDQTKFNRFETMNEMFVTLKKIYEHKNDESTTMFELNNSITHQRINELFVFFATRLTVFLHQTTYNDNFKIIELRKHMNIRCKKSIFNIKMSKNFDEYVSLMTNFDNNNTKWRQNSKFVVNKNYKLKQNIRIRNTLQYIIFVVKSNKNSKISRKFIVEKKNIIRFNKKIKQKILKKNFCVKCFFSKHFVIEFKTSCKNDFFIFEKNDIIKLTMIDIKYERSNNEKNDEFSNFVFDINFESKN